MEELLQNLITKIKESKELEEQNNDLINSNLSNKYVKLKDIIKYVYGELSAFDYYVPEEAKEVLNKQITKYQDYIDHNMFYDETFEKKGE